MRIIKLSLLLLILVSFYAHSQEESQEQAVAKVEEEKAEAYLNQQNIDAMMVKLNQLQQAEVTDFPALFHQVESEVLEFLQFKKKQCIGEFASVKIDEYGEKKLVKMKLSKTEREMCYREVKGFMRSYIDRAFDIKEDYLKRLLKTELKALEEAKQRQLKRIESLI
jgi:hypothetical protein